MSDSSFSLPSPSTPPFPFPRPRPRQSASPTSTSDSHTTASSTAVESSSHSDTPKAAGRKDNDDKVTRISSLFPINTAKAFGAGWMSSSSPTTNPLPTLTIDNPPYLQPQHIIQGRSRSPSMPTLPSQISAHPRQWETPTPLPTNLYENDMATYHLPSDLVQTALSTGQSLPSPYILTPPSTDQHAQRLDSHHFASLASVDSESEHDLNQTINASLLHHQSVPNLPQLRPTFSRKPSGFSVRFQDEDGYDGGDRFDPELPFSRGRSQRPLRRMPGFDFRIMPGIERNRLMPSRSMPAMQMVGEGRNVYIHRVSAMLSEEELYEYASSYGEVVSVKIPILTTKPHAFVMFRRPEQAQRFITHLQTINVECEYGKEDYQVQNKALEDLNSANLYISGLPTKFTLDDLMDLFAPGRICSWKPLVDEVGNRRGPVMARLQARPQADEVIRRLNGAQILGMSEKLQIRIADSEEQKHFKKQQGAMRDYGSLPTISALEQGRRRASMPANMIYADQGADVSRMMQTREELANKLLELNEKLGHVSISPRSPSLPYAFRNNHQGLAKPYATSTFGGRSPRAPWQCHGHEHSDGLVDAIDHPHDGEFNFGGQAHGSGSEPILSGSDFDTRIIADCQKQGGTRILRPVPVSVASRSRHSSLAIDLGSSTNHNNGEVNHSVWSSPSSLGNCDQTPSGMGNVHLHHIRSSPQLRTGSEYGLNDKSFLDFDF